MVLRRSVPVALTFACAIWGAARLMPQPEPMPEQAPAPVAAAPDRPVISADNTVLPDGEIKPPKFLQLRSLRTLRAGVFQMPLLDPRDFAVGPLAVAPIHVSLGEPQVMKNEEEPVQDFTLEGSPIRDRMKSTVGTAEESWPQIDRAGKGDLLAPVASRELDPALGDGDSREPVIIPFERDAAPASPLDGATPAASAPAVAAIETRTTAGTGATPVEVVATPIIALNPSTGDGIPPVPALGEEEGLTTVPRKVHLDDGLARPLELTPVADARAQTCLATAIYHEARGEPVEGQIAVAQVVINRVRSPYYPNDVCSVVYQNSWRRNACQFSFACDGIRDREDEPEAWEQAQSIARKVMDAEAWLPEVGNATHYHATYVRPRWVRDMVRKDRIGRHIFYRVRWWG